MKEAIEENGPLTIEDAEKQAGLLTEEEAARRLDWSVKTLRRKVRQGIIPEPLTDEIGKRIRHREKDISAYIRRYIAGESKSASA